MPRVLLPLPGGKDFLVTDVGRWDGPGGKVFRITAERGKPAVITPLLTGLYMPHHMAYRPRRQGLCQRTGPHLPL